MQTAYDYFSNADKILIVGTSLQVYPVAELVHAVPNHCEKVMVNLRNENIPKKYKFIKGRAAIEVPILVENWLKNSKFQNKLHS